MKTVFNLLVAAVLGAAALTPSARAQEVTLDLFYDSLADHGEWFEAADYGYVWHPADVGNDWRP